MSRIVIGAAISAALLAAAACGGASSPTSPSATPTAFQAQTFSASGVTSTTLSSHEHGNGAQNEPGEDGHGHGHEGQLEGTIVSIDTAHHSFVVQTTTVNVLAATIIRHGHTTLTFADLMVGQRVHVKGTPNGAAIDAREVRVQRDQNEDHDRHEAEGPVAGLTGTCPAVTFMVGTVKVTTTADTRFGRGGCAAVANGVRVEARGTIQPDGSLAAARVAVEHDGDDADD